MGMGDEIMAAGEVAKIIAAHGRTVRKVAVLHPARGLRWHDIWEGNPHIARPGEPFQSAVLNAPGSRPYIAAKTPVQWTWKRYGPPKGALYLTDAERQYGEGLSDAVIIQPIIKSSASPNKNWLTHYWHELIQKRKDIRWVQVGDAATYVLPGVQFVPTPSFRAACGALAGARAAVLLEGGLHHAAAALGIPAVVIFGGFISPAVTGYNTHRNLYVKSPFHPLGCGMRGLCDHCAAAMRSITPGDVARHLEEYMNERT